MKHRWTDEDLQQVKAKRVRAEGRSGNEQARASLGALAAPSPKKLKVKARTMGHTIEIAMRPSIAQQSFFVPGPLPGMNDYISTGSRFIYGNDKKKWRDIISHAIKDYDLGPMPSAWFRFQWREKTKRRDPDNFSSIGKKFIFDALVQDGILMNDGWEEILGWEDRWCIDADSPGVLIDMFSFIPGGALTIAEIGRRTGVSPNLIRQRIDRDGFSVERAVSRNGKSGFEIYDVVV